MTATLRGADLVNQLLSFARRRPLEPKRVDVNRLIAELRRWFATKPGKELTSK